MRHPPRPPAATFLDRRIQCIGSLRRTCTGLRLWYGCVVLVVHLCVGCDWRCTPYLSVSARMIGFWFPWINAWSANDSGFVHVPMWTHALECIHIFRNMSVIIHCNDALALISFYAHFCTLFSYTQNAYLLYIRHFLTHTCVHMSAADSASHVVRGCMARS
jgi:hypothetical protein